MFVFVCSYIIRTLLLKKWPTFIRNHPLPQNPCHVTPSVVRAVSPFTKSVWRHWRLIKENCLMTKDILIWNCSMKIKVFPASWSWQHLLSQRTQYFLHGTHVKIVKYFRMVFITSQWLTLPKRGGGSASEPIVRTFGLFLNTNYGYFSHH